MSGLIDALAMIVVFLLAAAALRYARRALDRR